VEERTRRARLLRAPTRKGLAASPRDPKQI
jgi:hypothetical protein